MSEQTVCKFVSRTRTLININNICLELKNVLIFVNVNRNIIIVIIVIIVIIEMQLFRFLSEEKT